MVEKIFHDRNGLESALSEGRQSTTTRYSNSVLASIIPPNGIDSIPRLAPTNEAHEPSMRSLSAKSFYFSHNFCAR